MLKTRDYRIFKDISGNRKVVPGHVKKLADAIERKNLLEYFPILCNEHMEVIDGQHRLSACVRLGIEVPYAKVHGLKIEDVMQINTNSKSWSITDFINSWIALGNKQYVVLKDFIDRYGMNPSTSAAILQGYSSFRSGGNTAKSVKTGDFKVTSLEYAEKIAEQIVKLKKYSDFDPAKDREFISALMRLNTNKDFDFERLVSKLQVHGVKIEKRDSEKYYIIHVEELYNFNVKATSSFVELYKSSYESSIK